MREGYRARWPGDVRVAMSGLSRIPLVRLARMEVLVRWMARQLRVKRFARIERIGRMEMRRVILVLMVMLELWVMLALLWLLMLLVLSVLLELRGGTWLRRRRSGR